MSHSNSWQMTNDSQVDPRLVGIRGWLVLPAIGLVVGLLVGIAKTGVYIVSLPEIVWKSHGVYVILTIIVRTGVLLYGTVALFRFLGRRKNAPETCIGLVVISYVAQPFLFILAVAVSMDDVAVPWGVVFLTGSIYGLAMAVPAALWIAYFIKSKRVKATFVRGEDAPVCLPHAAVVLSCKYLVHRRISWFSLTAVALCVFIVVVVMTVMSGLVGGFKQKNHEFVGDCVVGTKSLVGFAYYEEFVDILEQSDFIEAVSPVVKNYAVLRPEAVDRPRYVEIMGIDPVRHSRATNFAQTLGYRADDPGEVFRPSYDPNALGCVLGIDLALWRNAESQYIYDAQPAKRAFSLTCFPLNTRGAPARVGTSVVSTQRFFYSDHSHTGIARVDGSLVYIPLEQAQKLCMDGELKRVTAIHIKFRTGASLRQDGDRVRELWNRFKEGKKETREAYLLDTVTVQSWKEYRRAFVAPMEKEEALLSVMFGFVGMTTVFIVFVVFYMIVSHKRRDIGVLKSVGASNTSIMGLFSGFAFAVGLLGACGGTLGGLLFLANINRIERWLFERFGWQLWDRTLYAIGDIPNRVEFSVLAVIVCCAMVACLVGALVPGYCAARLRPVETLHGSRV